MEAEMIAKRYAQAVFEVVSEDKYDQLIHELEIFNNAMIAENLLSNYFDSPLITEIRKKDILAEIIGKAEFMPEVSSFFKVLLLKQRISLIPRIIRQLINIVENYRNIDKAMIYASFEISESDQLKIIEKLSEKLDKKLKAKLIVDPSLIGGIIVQVGNHIYDLSLKSKLEKLATHLEEMV